MSRGKPGLACGYPEILKCYGSKPTIACNEKCLGASSKIGKISPNQYNLLILLILKFLNGYFSKKDNQMINKIKK
jgi:hypothetical protein